MNDNIIDIRNIDREGALRHFRDLMAKVESALNLRAAENASEIKRMSPSEIERFVYRTIIDLSQNSPFRRQEIKLVSGARFPDIIVEKYYGVEVKSTIADHWTSTGSSIVESTRDPNVEDIYIIFGKLGGAIPQFLARPYSEVLSDIAVTHCPRYLINMELSDGQTIFDKLGIKYADFRKSDNNIDQVRHYYRQKSILSGKKTMPWWIGPENGNQATSMTVGFWRDLPVERKREFQAKIFILFPEVLKSDFDNASLWLCTNQSVLNPHIRDTFTAGGRLTSVDGNPLQSPAPQICRQLLDVAPAIRKLLSNKDFLSTEVAEFNPDLLKADSQAAQTTPLDNWLRQLAANTPDPRLLSWFTSSAILR